MKSVDTQDARYALASLSLKLKEHAELCDPAEIADAAFTLMSEVRQELSMLLAYLRAYNETIGLDELSLRDLLLAGDTVLVDFLTPDGPGRLAVACDEEDPVTFSYGPDLVRQQWRELYAH